MTIETLHGPWAWASQAHYAQAVRVGELIFTGGIGPFDDKGELISEDCRAQMHRVLDNLTTVLASFGAGLENVASMNVFVSDTDAYGEFQAVRQERLSAPYPASTAVGAGRLLAEGMRIEINAVACIGASRVEAGAQTCAPPEQRAE